MIIHSAYPRNTAQPSARGARPEAAAQQRPVQLARHVGVRAYPRREDDQVSGDKGVHQRPEGRDATTRHRLGKPAPDDGGHRPASQTTRTSSRYAPVGRPPRSSCRRTTIATRTSGGAAGLRAAYAWATARSNAGSPANRSSWPSISARRIPVFCWVSRTRAPVASMASTRVSATGESGRLVVAYIRNGPNGKWSSSPIAVPASNNAAVAAVTASRTLRPRRLSASSALPVVTEGSVTSLTLCTPHSSIGAGIPLWNLTV